jgi:hypothetical protein
MQMVRPAVPPIDRDAMAGLVPAIDVFKLEPNRWLDDARAIAGIPLPIAGDGS